MKGSPGIELLGEVGVALLAALLGGILARALRLPVLVGYLLAGVAVGPYTPGFIADETLVRLVADLGVALLMFAVGVHFSLDELNQVRRYALVGGAVQIIGTIVLGLLLGLAFGWGVYGGLFLGCALSLSSTAVMMKVLEERGELGATHGSILMGILIVQDLSLVLMIVLLPAFADVQGSGTASAMTGLATALLKAVLFVGAVILLAARVVPAVLDRIARTGARELFLLAVICLCLVAGYAADRMGLGLALGAFLGGLIVSESPYAHEIFTQVRPLRDVFASLFFVSVGMLLNPAFLVENALIVAAVVLAIVIGKAVIAMLPLVLLGVQMRTVLLVGLGLAQIGEFSFVLATVGSANNLIPAEISGVILSSALITILLTPFIYGSAGPLYLGLRRVRSRMRAKRGLVPAEESAEAMTMRPARPSTVPPARVIILGCGRVGRYVSDALRAKDVPHLVVDYDANAIARLKENGVPVVYGDATSEIVLEKAGPEQAELAIVALPEAATTEMVVRCLKEIAPNLPVVARVHRGQDIPRMRAAGADAVIHAEFEAGTEMIRQGLDRLGFSDPEVDSYIEGVRQHRYREEAEGKAVEVW